MSISELYSSVKKVWEQQDVSASGADERPSAPKTSRQQIELAIDQLELKRRFVEEFVPVFKTVMPGTQKSLSETQRYMDFFELYRSLSSDSPLASKAFEFLNEAIVRCPFTEENLRFRLFAERSNVHYRYGDLPSALKDLDHALQLRLSFSSVQRKVQILREMDQFGQACQTVATILRYQTHLLSDYKLNLFQRLAEDLIKVYRESTGTDYEELCQSMADAPHPPPPPSAPEMPATVMIDVDERVHIRESMAKRYKFIALEDIPAQTTILCEKPMVMTFRGTSHRSFCQCCSAKTANTFWPCQDCTEVVYCSSRCANQHRPVHQWECGLIHMMQSRLCSQALTAYRNYVQIGYENLAELQRQAEEFTIVDCHDQLTKTANEDGGRCMPASKAEQWFNLSQMKMFQRIRRYKPLRKPTELTSAVFLLMAHCYKRQSNHMEIQWTRTWLIDALDLLATGMLKCQLNEYGWHESNDAGEKVQLANFQCLIGSTIGHNCEPNAEWSFDGKEFKIKTTKHIDEKHEIAITYGTSREQNLFKRLKHLQNFYVMCSCHKCMKEVSRELFAFRCEHCNGPVPYDQNEFANEFCMKCELSYPNEEMMPVIHEQFKVMQRALCMIGLISHLELVAQIEDMMSTLACYVYLESDQFGQMVRKLCQRYFQLKRWAPAVEWYQWFIDSVGYNLATDPDDLIYLGNLKKWIHAYTHHFQQQLDDNRREDNQDNDDVGDDSTAVPPPVGKKFIGYTYVLTAFSLFEKLFKLLRQLDDNAERSGLLKILDREQLMKLELEFQMETKQVYDRFRMICRQMLTRLNERQAVVAEDLEPEDLKKLRQILQVVANGSGNICLLNAGSDNSDGGSDSTTSTDHQEHEDKEVDGSITENRKSPKSATSSGSSGSSCCSRIQSDDEGSSISIHTIL